MEGTIAVGEAGWEGLVRRLESKAREDPAAHRRKVVLLALLGYGFIIGFAALLLAIAVGVTVLAVHHALVLIKALIPIGALLWLIGRSLYVKFEPPTGVRITKNDAPELFRMLDDIKRRIRGPRIHRVLVDDRANAGIVQVPRAGGLLGSRNYLVLGLPYLLALTGDEFKAVMGHELGHLSRRHGRFGAFVYRVRQTWAQLLDAFEERRSVWTGLIRRFFGWYVPYFEAYTLPLARAHELEADDAAVEVAGRASTASSLVSGLLAARWFDEAYLPGVYERADTEAAPPATPFASLAERIPEATSYGNVRAVFESLLELETDVTDSHPSLSERLAHLEVEPERAFASATADGRVSAAQTYLGPAAPAVADALGRHWVDAIAPHWREAHASALSARQRLRELNGYSQRTPEHELERAQLTERFEGEEPALELYRGLAHGDQAPAARYAIGRILLTRGDDEGLRWLDDAMAQDVEAVLPACELAIAYLNDHGREEEAERYLRRGREQIDIFEAAAEEREGVSVDDELEPARLPDDLLESVRQKIRWRDEIAAAYLVRKRVEQLAEAHPFYVLAIVPKSGLRARWRDAADEENDGETLEEWLARMVNVPGELMVARIDKDSPIGKRVTSVDDALLFARD